MDEAGQALPQAAVGTIFRSKNIMVVGDPFQIKLYLLWTAVCLHCFQKAIMSAKSTCRSPLQYRPWWMPQVNTVFTQKEKKEEDSWIGIPLWVHRRCKYPMFTISNEISYQNLMVQGNEGYGKTGWYDISGKAVDKYVEEQGEFLLKKIQEMAKSNPGNIG